MQFPPRTQRARVFAVTFFAHTDERAALCLFVFK